MQSKTLTQSVAVALYAVTVHTQATLSGEPLLSAGDIEAAVPTQLLSPAEATSVAVVADSFIASVTAAPQFSSIVSVLATAIPITAEEAIANNPEAFLLGMVRGSSLPSWATSLPPSVEKYIESVAEDAAKIVTSDFAGLYTSVSSEVAAFATGASVSGGFASPTGGYGGSNFTGPRPTGSPAPPGSTPQPFPGVANSLPAGSVAATVLAAGMGVGAWLMF